MRFGGFAVVFIFSQSITPSVLDLLMSGVCSRLALSKKGSCGKGTEMSYDDWKLATPWDDEVALTVSYECGECEHEHDGVDAVGSRGSDEVIVHCENCDAENCVSV